MVQVIVHENNVDQALKVLKKKMQREGIFKKMKEDRYYLKPSEQKVIDDDESRRRIRKIERKRLEDE